VTRATRNGSHIDTDFSWSNKGDIPISFPFYFYYHHYYLLLPFLAFMPSALPWGWSYFKSSGEMKGTLQWRIAWVGANRELLEEYGVSGHI